MYENNRQVLLPALPMAQRTRAWGLHLTPVNPDFKGQGSPLVLADDWHFVSFNCFIMAAVQEANTPVYSSSACKMFK
jgi:hypothetical protein